MSTPLAPTEVVWRRVPANQIKPDGTPQSGAFRTDSFCIHRECLTNLATVRQVDSTAHIYQFTVQQILDAGATEVNDDRLAHEPPDHGMVVGADKKSVAKALVKIAVAQRVYP